MLSCPRRFIAASQPISVLSPRECGCLSKSVAAGYHRNMKVLLANPRGFCAGVNMAIESLELALKSLAPPIYVYHEIVHNQYVVNHFRSRGVAFVDTLDE